MLHVQTFPSQVSSIRPRYLSFVRVPLADALVFTDSLSFYGDSPISKLFNYMCLEKTTNYASALMGRAKEIHRVRASEQRHAIVA
jgi:hypothetical protein